MIQIKSPQEIEAMAKAGRVVAQVFEALESFIKPGLTTLQIANEAERIIRGAGAVPSFLNYGMPPFPGVICLSLDEEVVHGIPTAQRVVKNGSIVSADVGALLEGWHADAARTYLVGEVNEEARQLVKETEQAFWAGFEQAQVGNRLGDIQAAIQAHAEHFQYGIVRELTGHGIGRRLHEDPSIPNYGKRGRGPRLEAGMVLAIEPMLNLGTARVEILDDDWTVVTADGQVSAHYENTIAITDEGPRVLTAL